MHSPASRATETGTPNSEAIIELNTKAFNKVELTLDQALSYLRCEALSLPNAAAGVLLLTYENVPLGFVKNVGNHCNNLYPKEWRIRKL